MPVKQLVVAVSSTALDLPDHRKEVLNACLQQQVFPKMMEHLPASPDDAIAASMELIDIADIYLAIIAFRYGYVPGGHDISITEMEYNRAVERKIPRLVFLMHDEHPLKKSDVETGTGAVKLEALRKRMEKEQVVNYFKSPADLRALVVNSLSQLQQRKTNSGLQYDTAIVEMIHPAKSPYGALMNQFEPFPAFPYYSAESDHPSQWPPHIFKQRSALKELITNRLSGQAALELAAWRKLNPPKIKMTGTPESDPMLNYTLLRYFLTEHNGDYDTVRNTVGTACAEALAEFEQARRDLEENTPNRLMILRVKNQGDEDIKNFIAELTLNGYVYDVTVNSRGEKANSEQWTPNRFSVEVPLIQPGYTIDIFVWYYNLSAQQMVFPGAMDFKWAQTEGIVLENLAASGVRISHSKELLKDLPAYHRYPVNPVRHSPGFGRLEMPQTTPLPEEEKEETKITPSCLKLSAPETEGPYALFLHISISQSYQQKNDAFQAQVVFANALTSYYNALKTAIAAQAGQLVYELLMPVSTDFSKFSGDYRLGGKLLIIVKLTTVIDLEALPGLDIIGNLTSIHADYLSWDKSGYEVVLHFFTDTKDSKGDSKRVLTKKLPLSDIFNTEIAGENPNSIHPEFSRLLEYTRYRLAEYYGKDFTLEQEGDKTPPFYMVVRNKMISENFYLPASWMKIEKGTTFEPAERELLSARLSRMYDYANQSKELDKNEFTRLFN
jgi:Domain of unknown function (DUF4062)